MHTDIYFETFTSAVNNAIHNTESEGYVLSEEDIYYQITVGRGKPTAGETFKAIINLEKDGKPLTKRLNISIYNMGLDSGRTFELNYYVS